MATESKKVYGKGRTRVFAFIVYLDSAPENWQEILAGTCIPMFISPLHDQDINPTGEPKKPHHHVLLMFDSVKTDAQAQEIVSKVSSVPVERVNSLRGYARYLCHLDNPEKANYASEDVICFGGADYIGTIGLAIDKYKAIKEMAQFCADNSILSYSDLFEYAMESRQDWFRVLCDNGTIVMKEYLKSKAWTAGYRQ